MLKKAAKQGKLKSDALRKYWIELQKINKVTPRTKEIKYIVNLYIKNKWSAAQKRKFTDYARDTLSTQFNKNIEDRPGILEIEFTLSRLEDQIIR